MAIINDLPTEVLLAIFASLSGAQLAGCRQVCELWRRVIDASECIWKELCERDHRETYKAARLKANPSLTWRFLYKSLSLWSRFETAKAEFSEFAIVPKQEANVIRENGFLIENGILRVHKMESIVYYDAETLEQVKIITGKYKKFEENYSIVAFIHDTDIGNEHMLVDPKPSCLEIMTKDGDSDWESKVKMDDITDFLLVDQKVYHVKSRKEVYVSDQEDDFKSKYVDRTLDYVNILGYINNQLTVLAAATIYSLINGKLVVSHVLQEMKTMLPYFQKYDLLGRPGYLSWFSYNHKINSDDMFWNIKAMHVFGDMVLIVTAGLLLRIYRAPFSSDSDLDFHVNKPVREFNLEDFFSKDNYESIRKIDVLETESRHMIVFSLPSKMVILNLFHDCCETSASSIDAVPCKN